MRMQNPLSGWPKTKPLRKKKGYRVSAKYLTPERARLVDAGTKLLVFSGFAYIGWLYLEKEFTTGNDVFVALGLWGAASAFIWFTRYSWGRSNFGKTTTVQFQPDAIRIKSGMGYKNYDRGLPHEFDYSIHDKAQREEEQEIEAKQKAAMQGKKEPLNKSKYYRNAFHIVLRYAGQRVDVASVFGKKDAEALLVRLQLLDQMMDAARGDAAAPAWSEPATQYGQRPEAG